MGGPPRPPASEPIPMPVFEAVVAGDIDKQLSAAGFSRLGKRRWGKEWAPEINALIELPALKGGVSAIWGVSLTFVPHLEHDFRVGWHRTLKSARFDLSHDPRQHTKSYSEWVVSQLVPREDLGRESAEFAPQVVQAALAFLDPLRSLESLLQAYEAKRAHPFFETYLKGYMQELLAYAFVLARCGRKPEATAWLETYWAKYKLYHEHVVVPSTAEEEISRLLL
jgi:hypothetical protein